MEQQQHGCVATCGDPAILDCLRASLEGCFCCCLFVFVIVLTGLLGAAFLSNNSIKLLNSRIINDIDIISNNNIPIILPIRKQVDIINNNQYLI